MWNKAESTPSRELRFLQAREPSKSLILSDEAGNRPGSTVANNRLGSRIYHRFARPHPQPNQPDSLS